MRKFLTKKPVMITFIALTALFVALYIGLLCRPISYGMAYTNKQGDKTGVEVTTTIKVNSDKTARITEVVEKDGEILNKDVVDVWIYRNGDVFYKIGTKKFVEEIENKEKVSKEELEENNKNFTMSKDDYKAIITALEAAEDKGETEHELALIPYIDDVIFNKSGIYSATKTSLTTDRVYKSSGAVVFTVVGAIVIAGMLTFTVLSIVFTVKNKGKKSKRK